MLLNEFVTSKVYMEIAGNVCRNNELKEDLHAEAIITIIEKNFDLSEIRNPKYFFASIVWKTWMSNKFRKKYFKNKNEIRYDAQWVDTFFLKEEIKDEENEQKLYIKLPVWSKDKEITFDSISGYVKEDYKSDIDYYEKNLFRLYLEEGDCKKLHERTKIPYRTIANDIRVIKEKLKKLHNEENSD